MGSNHLCLTTQYCSTVRYNVYQLGGVEDETKKETVLTPGETVVALSRLACDQVLQYFIQDVHILSLVNWFQRKYNI